ncbi:SDR family oxidoreductase [Streptomyces malaysiensis]|uniref:Short-chain dehydrogenase/reductase SDR n=1 Tax=Streptomyces malaysiensis TaxID=92644 RepID=A0A7X6B104_STRMQ|nr:SDR family oxidoreductase [Streptomyces malaysiensis]NIY69365.1 short-chain dehydrogenase/reductase SDR [Streptomyces malaysiensis]
MSVVLITGAATGIGNLTAKALARAGHTVYASMRSVKGSNREHARELLDIAEKENQDLRVVELDVTSQEAADAAVQRILEETGQLDVVVQNAGHLYVGYLEAFTPEDLAHLFDTNVLGAHRVNRAALPHMRQRRAGTLIWVGSTIPITTPPFLGPYTASKAAMDSLAVSYAYELNAFGIESTIVMPGAFTQGTQHFPDASQAGDAARAAEYAELDPLVQRNNEAHDQLFPHGAENAHPSAVADEIVRVLALPRGTKPLRTVVDFTEAGVEKANAVVQSTREAFVQRMGFGELLQVKR